MEHDASDVELFIEEFERELAGQSDRGIVIVGATGLDVMLERLLAKKLNSSINRDQLFGPNSPLNELASRVKMALALGLISEDEYRELQQIRKIRNKIAHEVNVSLSSPSISDMVMQLSVGLRLYAPERFPFPDLKMLQDREEEYLTAPNRFLPKVEVVHPRPNDPRERFASSTRVLMRVLQMRMQGVGSSEPRAEYRDVLELWHDVSGFSHQALAKGGRMVADLEGLRDQLAQAGAETSEQEADIREVKELLNEIRVAALLHRYRLAVLINSLDDGNSSW